MNSRLMKILSPLLSPGGLLVLVTEEEIVETMRAIWERLKILTEPSSAVAAAPALLRKIRAEGKKVGIILSGGNVDLGSLPF